MKFVLIFWIVQTIQFGDTVNLKPESHSVTVGNEAECNKALKAIKSSATANNKNVSADGVCVPEGKL